MRGSPDSARQAIIVLGMHRSGTSAVTRVLNLLGADLPGELLPPKDGDNPTGYWESSELVALHDELLASVEDNLYSFSRVTLSEAEIEDWSIRLLGVLNAHFLDSTLFVIKDPRICRLVPLWLDVLRRFGAAPHFVLLSRDPREVAASLATRNGFPQVGSSLMWLRHTLDAECETRGYPRVFVSYTEVLSGWGSMVARIAHGLGIPEFQENLSAAAPEIEAFISPSMRHHAHAAGGLPTAGRPYEWVASVVSALDGLVRGETAAQRTTLDAMREQLNREASPFDRLFAWSRSVHEKLAEEYWRSVQEAPSVEDRSAYLEAEMEGLSQRLSETEAREAEALASLDQVRVEAAQAQERLRELEVELDGIVSSRSWKLTAPIRALLGRKRDPTDR